ncbi:HAAS signaling domain-containing protein [Paenibacillus segetis]|uniref:DUF1700 domain-containing protein n=1 Tax=Paenibacillus segetis TaxID=1325360 RepID=A0ABQ1YQA5_9BACL|nr:DUF1700 domain-containing protein [Paenibacillus segetis]GGH32421.1 hypothetical protein GCM10008013_36860 [Paenibacillus segetis]
MNKSQFLGLLHSHLSVLPPEECNELMEDYEAHFAFALQNGRTEEEVILELGHPEELAREALGNRFIPKEPVYWFGGQEAPTPVRPQVPEVSLRNGFMKSMVYTGLFFVDIIVVPSLLALWSFWICFPIVAFVGIISPVLLGLDYLTDGVFYPAKGYAVIALVGIGILFTIASKSTFKVFKDMSLAFKAWHTRTVKGALRHE